MGDLAERQHWMAILAKASLQTLEALLCQVDDVPDYRFLRSPETGLTMVRGRAGGVGQVFNLAALSCGLSVFSIAC